MSLEALQSQRGISTKAGFVISRVDGRTSLHHLIASIPGDDVALELWMLLQRGILELG